MLHINFHENLPAGFEDEEFERFLPYMGMEPSWSCDPCVPPTQGGST